MITETTNHNESESKVYNRISHDDCKISDIDYKKNDTREYCLVNDSDCKISDAHIRISCDDCIINDEDRIVSIENCKDVVKESFNPSVNINPPVNIKKRKSVEYNGMEFVFALLVLFENITDYSSLIQQINHMKDVIDCNIYANMLIFNKSDDVICYLNDILEKEPVVKQYIHSFQELNVRNQLNPTNIKTIYISGKTNLHAKINELNCGLDKKATKSDIYIEYNDNRIIGVSIKQSKCATKTNYSVHKFLGNELTKVLTNIKQSYLKEKGYDSLEKTRAHRKEINELFYPRNTENPYWIRLKSEIANNNIQIKTQLFQLLICVNLPYDVYEFDGSSFIQLNSVDIAGIDITSISFEEHAPYYLTTKGEKEKRQNCFIAS